MARSRWANRPSKRPCAQSRLTAKRAGLTAEQAARRLGVPLVAYRKLEGGERCRAGRRTTGSRRRSDGRGSKGPASRGSAALTAHQERRRPHTMRIGTPSRCARRCAVLPRRAFVAPCPRRPTTRSSTPFSSACLTRASAGRPRRTTTLGSWPAMLAAIRSIAATASASSNEPDAGPSYPTES